jgi:hypothetical protein
MVPSLTNLQFLKPLFSTYTIWHFSFAVACCALVLLCRFVQSHAKARAQFPGPPVKNFWMGNLHETMADNVHEKVHSSKYSLSEFNLFYSG